jgi:hypothetical protein
MGTVTHLSILTLLVNNVPVPWGKHSSLLLDGIAKLCELCQQPGIRLLSTSMSSSFEERFIVAFF